MLADVFESVVGAIYLDGGMEAVQPFILRFLDPEIDRVVRDAANNNYKSLLQQVAQREYGGTPQYQVLDEQGPDHHRSFKIAVDGRRPPVPGRLGAEQESGRVAGRPERPGRHPGRTRSRLTSILSETIPRLARRSGSGSRDVRSWDRRRGLIV